MSATFPPFVHAGRDRFSANMDREDEYFVPLEDQRVFGAGIKRKRIAFVPASSTETSNVLTQSESRRPGDKYLSIVLPKSADRDDEADRHADTTAAAATTTTTKSKADHSETPEICSVCGQTLPSEADKISVNAHESSIAHQVCVEHSHPPSHLDRGHVGVKYLAGFGWDPDSRKGLGARLEGIKIPIKAQEKHDTAGLRERGDDENNKTKGKTNRNKDERVVRLNAREVRKREAEAKKRAEKLRRSFYGQDVEKYLGHHHPDG